MIHFGCTSDAIFSRGAITVSEQCLVDSKAPSLASLSLSFITTILELETYIELTLLTFFFNKRKREARCHGTRDFELVRHSCIPYYESKLSGSVTISIGFALP